jgi:uncharacterized membrane protein YsdA (DUF1294 family)
MRGGAAAGSLPRAGPRPVLQLVLISVAAINLATFVAFGLDKWKARRAMRRIPEGWLLGMCFATGLIGGWIAMGTFRHKTSFRLKMVLVSVFNLAWVLVWLWQRGTLQ